MPTLYPAPDIDWSHPSVQPRGIAADVAEISPLGVVSFTGLIVPAPDVNTLAPPIPDTQNISGSVC